MELFKKHEGQKKDVMYCHVLEYMTSKLLKRKDGRE